jgi:hypothetical protein
MVAFLLSLAMVLKFATSKIKKSGANEDSGNFDACEDIIQTFDPNRMIIDTHAEENPA